MDFFLTVEQTNIFLQDGDYSNYINNSILFDFIEAHFHKHGVAPLRNRVVSTSEGE